MRTLVIGGTGPTGPHVVDGLRARGHEVTLLHRGLHEDGAPTDIEHIHTDPYSGEALAAALQGRHFDTVLALYGRLRAIGEAARGHTDHLIGVGGIALYRPAWARDGSSTGLPVPTSEDAPRVEPEDVDTERVPRFAGAMRRAEDTVLALGTDGAYRVSGVRYPQVYGPRNSIPWEWPVVCRVLDGRSRMIVPDDGLWIVSRCAARNAAELVLAVVDHPEVADGRHYNAADDEQFTVRQLAELVAEAAGGEIELVGVPSSIGRSAFDEYVVPGGRPHAFVDAGRARSELGYWPVVAARPAIAETVAWQIAHPVTEDNYPNYLPWLDYAAEDRIIDAYLAAHERLREELVEPATVAAGRGALPF